MKLSEICVRRPVFTVMMVVALLVLGYTSYDQMFLEDMPEIDFPFVIVQTVYPGAGAESVETEVSRRIEDALAPIEGVKHITSQSQEGYSLIFAEFILEMESKDAAQEVREKISQIRDQLPQDIEEPVVATFDPQSFPIISLTISGKRPFRDITTITEDEIQKRFESIPGVGSVTMVGGYQREINVFLDIDKMESYEITIDKVKMALQAANLEIPGGRVNERNVEYVVRTMGKLTNIDEFKNLPIDNPEGQPVYLRDIAEVVDGVEERRSLARVNGQESIIVNIYRQSGANTVEIAHMVKDEMAGLKEDLPPDMNIDIIVDNSTFTEDSIHEIFTNILFGGSLAIFVVFLFLSNIRPTIITAFAIPTSIISTFTFMKILDFTINNMSLMGLSLAVGFLIDDAIVVIENLYRHLAEGKSARKAALDATKEIGPAVIATSFSIIVVFLPVAFMRGIVGRFFYQFGMTVAFAVFMSLFVAFSLTPMLASRYLKREDEKVLPPELFRGRSTQPPRFFLWRVFYYLAYIVIKPLLLVLNFVLLILWKIYRQVLKIVGPFDNVILKLTDKYKTTLAWAISHRFIVLSLAAVIFVISIMLGSLAGSEFMPQTDRGQVSVQIETPPGTDLKTTSQRIEQVENIISRFEGIELIFTTIGGGENPVNNGNVFIKLVDQSERDYSAMDLVDSVREAVSVVPGIEYAVSVGEHEGGGDRAVEISIRGSDINILSELAHEVEKLFRETYGTVDIDNTLEEGKPELKVIVDRGRANDLAVDIYGVASSIRSFVDGEVVTRYKEGDKEYDVRIRLKESGRESADDIGRLLIASNKDIVGVRNFLVPLSHVAEIKKSESVGRYNRFDRQREVKVISNVTSDSFSGTVLNKILAKTRDINLPPGYVITVTGMGEIMQESFVNINLALMLAVIFIYLLLSSQFESFFDSFAIMFSLPLSWVGAIILLLVTNSSISIVSMIGVILLMGLVTKNAILLVDFIKQNRRRGLSRTEAILKAGPIRLRPILMTALSTILGMTPLALALGPGAEFRAPMARAVIGGLFSSTVLTLVVVPVVYTVIDDIVKFFTGRETIQVEKEEVINV